MPAGRIALFFSLLLLAGTAGSPALTNDIDDVMLETPFALSAMGLDSTAGIPVNIESLSSKWTFISLGYTSCPDVCPFTLGNLAAVEAAISQSLADAEQPSFIFVSVDPSRDDLETLRDYVRHFSDTFIGATGSRKAIDAFTTTLKAFYRLGRKDADGDYPVDHSAYVYLIGPKAEVVAKFEPPLNPGETSKVFREIRARYAAATKG